MNNHMTTISIMRIDHRRILTSAKFITAVSFVLVNISTRLKWSSDQLHIGT